VVVQDQQRTGGRLLYRATYSFGDDGTWQIRVETDDAVVRTNAVRLADIERRAYDALRAHTGLRPGTFDIAFEHVIDLTDSETPSG
jgi:hypothetical protein